MLPQLHCGNFMAREFIGQMKTKFIFIVNSFSWILLPAWTHLPSLLIPAKSIVRSPFPLSRDNLLHHSIPLLWITNAVQRPHTVSYMVPFVHQNNPQRQPPHSLSCFTAMVTLLTPWEFVTNYHSMEHIGQCLLITVHQIQVDYNFNCQPFTNCLPLPTTLG